MTVDGSSWGSPAASRPTRPASCCAGSPSRGTTSPSCPPRRRWSSSARPTWAALSGKPVSTDVWTDVHEVPHVHIGQSADVVVVAPATADLLAKAAHGLADDLLTNTLLTARCPVVFAPAMHTEMWEHPATQANVATLRQRGAIVIEPAEGRLTGADTGKGRLPEPAEIFELVRGRARPRPDAGPGPRRSQGRRLRRRHPRVPRPGPLPRQPLLRAPGLRPRPGRGLARAPTSRSSAPTSPCPTRPASASYASRRPRSCARPSSPRPRPPTPW